MTRSDGTLYKKRWRGKVPPVDSINHEHSRGGGGESQVCININGEMTPFLKPTKG
jgi:hypothetical protein